MAYLDFLSNPSSIITVDYEAILSNYKTRLLNLNPSLAAALGLEQSATNIILEAEAYGEMLVQQRINLVYQALRLAYATGTDLDGLAADRGVVRLTYAPAVGLTPAILESDDDLRLRTFLRMQSWGSGSLRGIEYWARTLGSQYISDAHAVDYPGEGRIDCVVLPNPNNTDAQTAAMISTVSTGLMARSRRPGAVYINTVASDIVPLDYVGTIAVRFGASTTVPLAAAQANLTAYMASRRRVGAIASRSEMMGVQAVYNVVNVLASQPVSDIIPTDYQTVVLRSVNITPVIVRD